MRLHNIFSQFVVERRTYRDGAFSDHREKTKKIDKKNKEKEKRENEKEKRGLGLCWSQFGLQEVRRRKYGEIFKNGPWA